MSNEFKFSAPLSIKQFADTIGKCAAEMISYYFFKGKITTLQTILSEEMCKEMCNHFSIPLIKIPKKKDTKFDHLFQLSKDHKKTPRSPIVTIMGHVDHGKTSLLDKIRSTKVAASEHGGITQSIGAYRVPFNNKSITFIDTPGHELFTKMRARGAQVTDIIVLVVSAVDGIQPQTIESIQHSKGTGITTIVFINKIDKGLKNIGHIKQELSKHDVLIEEYGGDVMCVQGSALTGEGIQELLESIILLCDVLDLKTTSQNPAIGTVIETKMKKGIGATATVILKFGELNTGNYLVTKSVVEKVKSIVDENNKQLKTANASVPVVLSPFKKIPVSGEKIIIFNNEQEAIKFHNEFKNMNDAVCELGETTIENPTIIKADCGGSLEVLENILNTFSMHIVSSGIGPITETDMQLAAISNAVIINFNQKIPNNILIGIKKTNLIIKDHKTVYALQSDLLDMTKPDDTVEKIEEIVGVAEVVKLWHHSKVGTIAGCKTVSGFIDKKNKVYIFRGEVLLATDKIKTLKCESYEIEVSKEGQECGISVHGWNDIKIGDTIKSFKLV